MPHRGMAQNRRIALWLDGGADAAGDAREVVRELDAQLGRVLLDVQLVISELVTNAWRHGHGGDERAIQVTISIEPAQLGVEVRDHGDGFARPAINHDLRGKEDGGGWGLLVVDRLAVDWGVRRNGDTCVWALIANPET
jgi:anti-sigma regulatory factor (Ser/Thr protein kinase)